MNYIFLFLSMLLNTSTSIYRYFIKDQTLSLKKVSKVSLSFTSKDF